MWKLKKFCGPLVAHHNVKSSCLSQQNVHQYGYLQVGLFISLPPPINLFKSRDFITIIDFATNVTVWERVEGEAIIPASLENIEVTYLHTTASYFWPPNILLKKNPISLIQWLPLDHLDRQAATRHVEHLEAEGETNINGALLQALNIVSQTQV